MICGKVGDDLTEEQGKHAARQVGLTILATLKSQLGSLDRVDRVLKVLGMVNAAPDFQRHPQVINGFSELMVDIFGEAGKGGTKCRWNGIASRQYRRRDRVYSAAQELNSPTPVGAQ